MAGGHDALRALTRGEIGAETDIGGVAVGRRDGQRQRRPGVPVPDLGGIDAMPCETSPAASRK